MSTGQSNEFEKLSFDTSVVKALQQSTHRYKTLFEGANDAIFLFDFEDRIRDANQVACERLGYSHVQLLNMSPLDISSPEEAELWPKRLEKLRKIGHIIYETVYRAKNGSLIPIEISSRIIEFDEEPSILTIARDISDRKEAEREKTQLQFQLRQAQKMEAIGTLAGGIAHDFNNILQAIIGYTEITLFQIRGPIKAKESLNEIIKACDRARDLINQILSFSRNREQKRKPIEISLMVKEVLKLIKASFPATIEIRQNIHPNSGTVEADPVQIHQIMMNLCTNAYHAMREKGGTLEVLLRPVEITPESAGKNLELTPGAYVELAVKDNGYGISADKIDRIFEPYYTTKEMGEGTGLGLAVVHGIVTSYGGAIKVHSQPGKGSVFHVYFPRLIQEVKVIDTEKKDAFLGGNEKILLVDDDQAIVYIVKQMLENLGYEVTAQYSSPDALSLFSKQSNHFDLVITDMTMPKMTGDILAQKINQIRPDIPIILFTGYGDMIAQEKAKALGIKAFLMKPLQTRDLACTIRQILGKPIE
jgi:PAS domain S-box-containing protein